MPREPDGPTEAARVAAGQKGPRGPKTAETSSLKARPSKTRGAQAA